MSLDCTCDEWKTSGSQLHAFAVLAFTHGMFYTGKQFIFCPWCGKKLNEEHYTSTLVMEKKDI